MLLLDKFEFRGDKMLRLKAKIRDDSQFADYVPLNKIITEQTKYYEPPMYWMSDFSWWEEIPMRTVSDHYRIYYTGEEKCQPKPLQQPLLSRRELIRSPKLWAELMSTAINSWRN